MKLSTCLYCNKIFSRHRNTKQFCSLECKNKFNYARRNDYPVPVEELGLTVAEPRVDRTKEKELQTRINELEDELKEKKEEISELKARLYEAQTTAKSLEVESRISQEVMEPEQEAKAERSSKKGTSESSIPFISKKERILDSLVAEEIFEVTKDELKALGYPLGFFDGWTEAGEELVNYNIERGEEEGEYKIVVIT